MELPSWLKIDSIVKYLNVSGWFKNWFHKTEVNINLITYHLNIPPTSDTRAESSEEAQKPKLLEETKEVTFTSTQSKLISKINRVHKISGNNNYDFLEDYKWALYYIKYKPAKDWKYNAAIRIAQAMQDINFFDTFKEITEPKKKVEFDSIKGKINYLYNRIIQELRHIDKRDQIEKQFKAPYHNELQKSPEIKDSDYENIFNDFQELLIKLFNNFTLKQ